MRYMTTLLDFLFGCHHNGLSRVFTIAGRSYRVCCDCGAEFKYSLETMSIVQRDFLRPRPCAVVRMTSGRVWRHAA